MITAYQKNGLERVSFEESEKNTGRQTKKLCGENKVYISLSLDRPANFQTGDYVTVYGERYYLNNAIPVNKRSSAEYVYNLVFEGEQYFLNDISMLFKGLPEFYFFGTARQLLTILIENVNRVSSGWLLGEVADTTACNVYFANENCMSALTHIATVFNIEYYFIGRTLFFKKTGNITGIHLTYGQGYGLQSLSRQIKSGNENKIVTRLYVYGSSRNIPIGYRNYSGGNGTMRLMLPEGTPYLESNTEKYGIIEDVYINDDIFPHRAGTITSVTDEITFTDSSMPFDLNDPQYRATGISPRVAFLSGNLADYEFEIQSYRHDNKTFKLAKNTNEKAFEGGLPNEILKPEVGDEYTLIDIILPDEYIITAENDLKADGQAEFNRRGIPIIYKPELDPFELRRRQIVVSLLDIIYITDNELGIDSGIRTIGYSRNIFNAYEYSDVELSEKSTLDVVRVIQGRRTLQRAIDLNNLNNINQANNNWIDSQSLLNKIEGISKSEEYTQEFSNTSSGTIAAADHGQGTSPKATIYRYDGEKYIEIRVESLIVDPDGNITWKSNFPITGKIVISK